EVPPSRRILLRVADGESLTWVRTILLGESFSVFNAGRYNAQTYAHDRVEQLDWAGAVGSLRSAAQSPVPGDGRQHGRMGEESAARANQPRNLPQLCSFQAEFHSQFKYAGRGLARAGRCPHQG